MKVTPGTLQDGGASFDTTHWSVVAQSALTNVAEAENALAKLCGNYWPPIYSFIRRRGYSPVDAQDLTQSFFAFFLRTKAYARVDRLHGRFRSFLLASVKNFLSDNWDRDRAAKRGGNYEFVLFDQQTAEAIYDAATASDSTAESLFDVRWAKTLTAGALNSLRHELHSEGKTDNASIANAIGGDGTDIGAFEVQASAYVAQIQQPIDADGSSVFSVKRGVVPVKFTLMLNGVATCDLPPATIVVTRTAGGYPWTGRRVALHRPC